MISNARLGELLNAGIPTRTKTYTNAAAMAIANAIKTSIATSLTAQSYSGGALNGSIGAGAIDLPQSVTATTSASAATYATGSTHPIVVTGTDFNGAVITGNIILTAAGGGETVAAVDANGAIVGFASVTSIAPPAQLANTGAFTFGVRDVVLDVCAIDLRSGNAGNLALGYPGPGAGYTDTVPVDANEHVFYAARVIYSSSTSFPITIGL